MTRYCNLFRHRVSGRAERRLLNRAASCALCGQPMTRGDRWLYRAYTGFMEFGLIAAHPSCADAEVKLIGQRLAEELARPATPEALMLLAAVIEAEERIMTGPPFPGGYTGLIGVLR
jgi:hypothetical protein